MCNYVTITVAELRLWARSEIPPGSLMNQTSEPRNLLQTRKLTPKSCPAPQIGDSGLKSELKFVVKPGLNFVIGVHKDLLGTKILTLKHRIIVAGSHRQVRERKRQGMQSSTRQGEEAAFEC